MRFFTRCKILYRILMVFLVCMGIMLTLQLLERKTCDLTLVSIFVFLLIYAITLRCIIADAEEDLTAVAKLVNESKAIKEATNNNKDSL